MPTATFLSIQRIGTQLEEHWNINVSKNEQASIDVIPKYIQRIGKVQCPADFSILADNKTVRLHNYPLLTNPTIDTTGVVAGHLTDLTVNNASAFNGTRISNFKVIITTAAGTDKFDWYQDGVLGAAAVSITGANQTLANGIQIKFGAITGHTANDFWLVTAEPNPTKFDLLLRGLGG